MTLPNVARLSILVLYGPLLTACAEHTEGPEAPPRPVRYVEVHATDDTRIRSFAGVAKAGIELAASFKVGGTLRTLTPKIGDTVRKGQLLAALDPRDYEVQAEEVEASVADARAQAVKANSEFNRIRSLYERDNASQGDYDAALAAKESAEARLRSTEKRLEGAKLQLSYARLEAPFGAAVADVPVEVNENVSAGQPIVILNSGLHPEVEVRVPEVLVGQIKIGDPATVTYAAISQREYAGKVTEVAVVPGKGASTYPVTVALDRPWGEITDFRPGLTVDVTFRFGGGGRPRHVLPSHAVLEGRSGKYVWVIQPKGPGLGVIERRPVTIGDLVSEGIEVLEGLRDGEKVVTAGTSQIQAGQEVSLQEETPS